MNTQRCIPSLVELCRRAIVKDFERYPPRVFMAVDEEEWNALVRRRHQTTNPKEGTGGIDGTGRLTPALSEKYVRQVEEVCPHLASSNVADDLLWRDCVEFRFKREGMTRPKSLELPWPMLIKSIQDVAEEIQKKTCSVTEQNNHEQELLEMMASLQSQPMNISLLKQTEIGKVVKRILKKKTIIDSVREPLETLLQTWKDVAVTSGVQIEGHSNESPLNETTTKQSQDLILAETCKSWRQLYTTLKKREESRRSSQGKRMREIRQNLSHHRPKVVKVRPLTKRKAQILEGVRNLKPTPPNPKVAAIRSEASTIISRRATAKSTTTTKPPASSSFGAAVAFASGPKTTTSGTRRKLTGQYFLPGEKQMKIPKPFRDSSPKRLASKFKKI